MMLWDVAADGAHWVRKESNRRVWGERPGIWIKEFLDVALLWILFPGFLFCSVL